MSERSKRSVGRPRPRKREAWQTGAPGDLKGLHAAMRRYLEHRAVIGSTDVSLNTMHVNIHDFIAWADERGVTHPQQVTRSVLQRYQRWLHYRRKADGQPLSLITQRTKVGTLRSWFRWLTREGEIAANPAADLDMPRKIHRVPRAVLSEQEAERVLAMADLTTTIGLRDRALMEVLYATGMRRMEVAGLLCEDIDAQRCLVFIRQGKGRKDRLIPLGERALYWVQRYLEQGRDRLVWNPEEHALFLTVVGEAMSVEQLTPRMAGYVKAAGITKPGGCHLWRHTMATLMLEGGADIRFIQVMLGHSDLSSTQIYTRVALAQLSRVHAQTHPGALRRRAARQDAQQMREVSTPSPESPDTAEALLEALACEAEDEQEQDNHPDEETP
jgi:integrase/recombinase XerD